MIPYDKQVEIFRNFLISFHTANWTGNTELSRKYASKMGDFSYNLTNSFEGDSEEDQEKRYEYYLLKLVE